MAAIDELLNSTAARYGIDPRYLSRAAQIESRNNAAARNPSGASGLFQFMPKTWAQYGRGADPFDAGANADAAARLYIDNSRTFTKAMGRAPTAAEAYLMHQQGAGGAVKLLQNPNAPAASIVGQQAVVQNGGHAGMTGADFANLWLSRFGGQDGGEKPVGTQTAGSDVQVPPVPARRPLAGVDWGSILEASMQKPHPGGVYVLGQRDEIPPELRM